MKLGTLVAAVSVAASCDAGPTRYEKAATAAPRGALTLPGPPPKPPERLSLESIAPDERGAARIEGDVAYLASKELAGRRTGEEGARLAADFIAKRFGELGLEPFGDRDGGAGARGAQRSFFFRYSPAANASVSPPELEITEGGKAHTFEVSVIRTADGAATAEVRGTAVSVGWGVSIPEWDDYAGAKLDGKIAVVVRGSPKIAHKSDAYLYELATFRNKIKTARAHGAIGLLVVSGTEALPPDPLEPRDAGLPAVVIARSAARGLFPGLGVEDGSAWAATRPSEARELSGVEVRIKTRVESKGKYATDVVGLVPAYDGSPRADEWVVLGAHYDHIGMGGVESLAPGVRALHPGADDNASGTALVMEVARRLEALPRRPARNVICMSFSGEEEGLLGSRAWVDDPPVPMKHVVAMLNADMVGRLRKSHLIVLGTSSAPGWGPLFDRADLGLGLEMGSDSGEDLSDRSDQASFLAEGVPIAFLFTGLHPDYHRPSDTVDKINAPGIEEIATLSTRVIVGLAEDGLGVRPERPK